MCGIIGCCKLKPIGIGRDGSKYVKQALLVDLLRGEDSTGVAMFDFSLTGRDLIVKRALSSYDFMDSKKVDKQLNKLGGMNLVIGHNRAATAGSVIDENAHPFQHGKITMVHNGTIHNKNSLTGGTGFSVDSEAICYSLDVDGVQKTVEAIDGAFSLVWYDSEEQSLNFIRNDQRPMVIGYSAVDDMLVWGSEYGMVEWISERNHIYLETISSTPEMVHMKYDMTLKTITKPEATVMKEYTPPKSPYGYGGSAANTGYSNTSKKTQTSLPTTTGQSGASFRDESLVVYKGNIKHPVPDHCPQINDRVEVYACELRKSIGGNTLVLEGVTYDQQALTCVVCNIAKGKKMYEGAYQAQVLNVVWSKVDNEHVLYCRLLGKRPLKNSGSGDLLLIEDNLKEVTPEKKEEPSTEGGILEQTREFINNIRTPDVDAVCYRGPVGLVTSERWSFLTRLGCSCCCTDMSIIDSDYIHWMDQMTPLCPDCSISYHNGEDLL